MISNKNWTSDEIPDRPFMELEGINLLYSFMKKSKIYLEYGSGGSTIMAANLNISEVHTVDSDLSFMMAVKTKALKMNVNFNLTLHYCDIGQVREFGNPIDTTKASSWPKYCIACWNYFLDSHTGPDLILVDGRFRVACFLASLLLGGPNCIILFDDYFGRSQYQVVEDHIAYFKRSGRMACFRIPQVLNAHQRSKIMLDVLKYSAICD